MSKVTKSSFCHFLFQSSSLVRTYNKDEFVHNVHLRKLNQPFEWHSQAPGNDPDTKDLEKFQNSTEPKKKPSTCRNSVQGKVWIADDQGKKILVQHSVYISKIYPQAFLPK